MITLCTMHASPIPANSELSIIANNFFQVQSQAKPDTKIFYSTGQCRRDKLQIAYLAMQYLAMQYRNNRVIKTLSPSLQYYFSLMH